MRYSIDHRFMAEAERIAKLSNCAQHNVGCVLVSGSYVQLSKGFNIGAFYPTNQGDCLNNPCGIDRDNDGDAQIFCHASHAEQVAVTNATGVIDLIHTAYVTRSPCRACVKLLLATPCQRIVFAQHHGDNDEGERIWRAAGRVWEHLTPPEPEEITLREMQENARRLTGPQSSTQNLERADVYFNKTHSEDVQPVSVDNLAAMRGILFAIGVSAFLAAVVYGLIKTGIL